MSKLRVQLTDLFDWCCCHVWMAIRFLDRYIFVRDIIRWWCVETANSSAIVEIMFISFNNTSFQPNYDLLHYFEAVLKWIACSIRLEYHYSDRCGSFHQNAIQFEWMKHTFHVHQSIEFRIVLYSAKAFMNAGKNGAQH